MKNKKLYDAPVIQVCRFNYLDNIAAIGDGEEEENYENFLSSVL